MAKVVLISCSSEKNSVTTQARNMYVSSLFVKSLKYAQQLSPDCIFILSAKYGLLELDRIIDVYDETLRDKSSRERSIWGKTVISRIEEVADIDKDEFIFLAGELYISSLRQYIPEGQIKEPLKGKRVGERLQWLNTKISQRDA